MNKLEDLKTTRLLILQLSNDAERTFKRMPAMSREREVLVSAYTKIQIALTIIENQIREQEEKEEGNS